MYLAHQYNYHDSEEISQERLNKLRGVANVKRVDQTLYGDYESEDARKVCRCCWEALLVMGHVHVRM